MPIPRRMPMHRPRAGRRGLLSRLTLLAGLVLGLSLWLGALAPAQAQDLAQIRARGSLLIGTSGTAPPNTWVNKQNQLVGYDIDWGTLIGAELNLPVRWVKVDFRGLMPALSSGTATMAFTWPASIAAPSAVSFVCGSSRIRPVSSLFFEVLMFSALSLPGKPQGGCQREFVSKGT